MSGLAHFLVHQHHFGLILVAAIICFIASLSTIALLRLSQDGGLREQRRWRVVAAAVSGFGIWATHFVAMMAYQTEVPARYSLPPTIASLLVAISGNIVGYHFASKSRSTKAHCKAAMAIGLGIVGMHYLGMYGTDFSGQVVWVWPMVALSILFAVAPNILVLRIALHRKGRMSAALAVLLMLLATVALHFTGMAAFHIIPSGEAARAGLSLSNHNVAIVIGVAAVLITALATISAGFSAHARSVQYAREREFRIFVQSISDCALYMLDEGGKIASWNIGAQRLHGYPQDEAMGMHIAEFQEESPDRMERTQRKLEQAQQEGSIQFEDWRHRKDGSKFWAEIYIEAIFDANGDLGGYAKITRDVTKTREQKELIRQTSANLDAALSNMAQGLCLFSADETLVLMNDRITELFGIRHEDCPPDMTFPDLFRLGLEKRDNAPVDEEQFEEIMARHRACLQQEGGGSLFVPFSENCTLSVVHQPIEGGGWVTTFEDVTERHRAEQKIEFLALHDTLTSLPNRFNYNRQLEREIKLAARTGDKVAVIGIDLDGFKEINDFQGHATGDLVLKSIGDRLAAAVKVDECVARFGGDEFAALKRFKTREECDDFVARLAEAFEMPLVFNGYSITPAASLGVSVYPLDGQRREQMINNADLAMYRAKELHGTQVCYYEHGMDEAARARRMLANDLRHAIEKEELSLAFQVQRSVRNGDITGHEALLRWQHGEMGWISPDRFIPLAEENGSIIEIGEWVLHTACHAATTWPKPWKVAVNLSAIQLTQCDFPAVVERILAETGLPANRLELEVTETAFISDRAKALASLQALKALGVSIAIDDFGTGYSSLDTLNSFPFDKIKIDKSFLLDSDDSPQSRAIIRAVLALGKSLEVPVLAEGLETTDQLALLQLEGCDYAQGYLWGRPVFNLSAEDALLN